jgi:hypothetical protein
LNCPLGNNGTRVLQNIIALVASYAIRVENKFWVPPPAATISVCAKKPEQTDTSEISVKTEMSERFEMSERTVKIFFFSIY